MRALESGETALYKSRESIQDESRIPAAIEQALVFAESLGFLFDEDMIDVAAGTGRHESLDHWSRLMGDDEVYAPGAPAEPPPPASNPGTPTADQTLLPPAEDLLATAEELDLAAVSVEGRSGMPSAGRGMPRAEATEELLLDDLMDEVDEASEAELMLEPSDTLTGAAVTVAASAGEEKQAADPGDTGAVLSKFRTAAAKDAAAVSEEPDEAVLVEAASAAPSRAERVVVPGEEGVAAEGAGAAALGKIAIQRQKGEAARALLARLLSSF